MPRKLSKPEVWPTLVQERLTAWGKCIHTQRLRQRIPIDDLSARIGVSRSTLLRLEKGDPGASAGAYLTAFLILGVAEDLVPPLPAALWQGDHGRRVKLRNNEKSGDDPDYF